MEKMTVTLRTVTPLFLGDAMQLCELRPPDIKSALRFWFRFIEGGRQSGDVARVSEQESKLFGSTDTGVGRFSIRLADTCHASKPNAVRWPDTLGYLGLGITQFAGSGQFKPTRPFIEPGTRIEFELRWHREATQADRKNVFEALWLWTHLGGWGSRARRGWGCLELVEVAGNPVMPAPINGNAATQGVETALKNTLLSMLRGTAPASSASYTHIMKGLRIVCAQPPGGCTTWDACASWIGGELRRFRSNFHGSARNRFWKDHQLTDNFLKGGGINELPERAIFGLPHNYFFSSRAPNKKKGTAGKPPEQVNIAPQARAGTEGRRASPLFIRIHRMTADAFVVILTKVPSQFLDGSTQVVVKADSKEKDQSKWVTKPAPKDTPFPPPNNFAVLDEFMNKFGAGETL